MPNLSWPEIKHRATAFAREWREVESERAEAQTFWNEFFQIFGVKRRSVAVYEQQVDRLPEHGHTTHGRIDLLWPGTLLAEHKSAGRDLDAAHTQAIGYFLALDEADRPRYVVVSDFQRFRLYDLDENTEIEFNLAELPARVSAFGFIAGYTHIRLRDEPEANIKAVQKLGDLHDTLKGNGYGVDTAGHATHPLQVFLVRVLFCLFADDTGLFSPKDSFLDLLENTRTDGSDTGTLLAQLFQALNKPVAERQHTLAEKFSAFPYVNGRLFEEPLPIPEFDAGMRTLLLDCCKLQWAGISPAIFGAMFQKIIELDASDRRRQLGAHYTSEANILKLIGPLFLDELRAEFERVKRHKDQLFEFHKKLRTLTFFDPACGCGNFLVITYRELRRLELDVLIAARAFGHVIEGVFRDAIQVDVDQFYGIEVEDFPAQIAQVAMWLTDHQMNLEAGREFAEYFNRLPLAKSAHIRHGNALRLDWEDLLPPHKLNYILGNPPFVGKHLQTDDQEADLASVAGKLKGAGLLDYVCGWYLKAAQYLSGGKEAGLNPGKKQFADVRFGKQAVGIDDIFVTLEHETDAARQRIRGAFVSTNSITQGEQVGVLWSELFRRGMHIRFAHRTFKWSNEAPGKAAVHCVIIGFGFESPPEKRLFEYADIAGPANEVQAANINPYLVDAPDVVLPSRRAPFKGVPAMLYGNKPADGGFLLLSDAEREELLRDEPAAAPWIKPFVSAHEFLHGESRWCLWLVDIAPQQLQKLPRVLARVNAVRAFRSRSKKGKTAELAETPTLFAEIRQSSKPYLLVPCHSSENRRFVPLGYLEPDVIVGNSNLAVPDAPLWLFGIMSSTMHMAWVRNVCGRLESRYRYSAQIVYNNYPWPQNLDADQRAAIETAAQGVLDARAAHPGATLAELYGPTMPPNLVRAHAHLDRAVDAAYRADGAPRRFATDAGIGDAQRAAFLFRRYADLTSVV